MLSSIGETMLGHVVRYNFAQQIWSVLEQLFQSQSRARVLQLKKMSPVKYIGYHLAHHP